MAEAGVGVALLVGYALGRIGKIEASIRSGKAPESFSDSVRYGRLKKGLDMLNARLSRAETTISQFDRSRD